MARQGRELPHEGTAGMVQIDLLGLKCPMPALRAAKRLESLPSGAELAVLADDPLAPLDIQHLCNDGGHRLLSQTVLATGGWRFVIRRA
jgi:tRNA 2-thiouridine synthesizing protein A